MKFQTLLSALATCTLTTIVIAAPIQMRAAPTDLAIELYAKSCGPDPVGTIAAREETEVFATCGH